MFRAGESATWKGVHRLADLRRGSSAPFAANHPRTRGICVCVRGAGGAITGALSEALAASPWFDHLSHFHAPVVIEKMKHELCSLAIPDLQTKLQQPDTSDFEERAFQLPDGSVIEVRMLPPRQAAEKEVYKHTIEL